MPNTEQTAGRKIDDHTLDAVAALGAGDHDVPLDTIPDDVLPLLVTEARQLIEDSQRHAIEGEQEAAQAAAAFKANPNEATFAEKAIAAQVAENRQAHAKDIEHAQAPLFAEQQRRKNVARLAEVRALDAVDHVLPRIAAEIEQLYVDHKRELRAKLLELGQDLAQCEAVRGERNRLETLLGDKLERPRITFERALEAVRAHLVKRIGPEWNGVSHEGTKLVLHSDGRGHVVRCEVVFRLNNTEAGVG